MSAFSFFPNADAQEQLVEPLGSDLWQLLDIVKVRGFARKQRDVYWLQAVPIVVLKPLEERSLESSLISCLARAEGLTETDSTALLHYAHTPRARQRLLQYLLSSIVGHHFIDRMKLSVSRSLRFSFDMRETDRHYGPWLHDSMKVLTSCERLVPDPQILKDAEHPKPGVTPAGCP